MSATTWLIIAIVGFSLSGIALAAAVFMFIKMDILAVIGDLTGKTVAREIKAMREANASSGDKLHKSSRVNIERGKLTEKVNDQKADNYAKAKAHASKRLDKTGTGKSSRLNKKEKDISSSTHHTTESFSSDAQEVDVEKRKTDLLPQNKIITDILESAKKTDVLNQSKETELLTPVEQTEVLSTTHQTTVLDEERGGTTVLSEAKETQSDAAQAVSFKVTKSVVKIHTDEVI